MRDNFSSFSPITGKDDAPILSPEAVPPAQDLNPSPDNRMNERDPSIIEYFLSHNKIINLLKKCKDLKEELLSIPSIIKEFERVEMEFPETKSLFTHEEVIDLILCDLWDEKTQKALMPDATPEDLSLYKKRLERVVRGTHYYYSKSFDAESSYAANKHKMILKKHDIDFRGLIRSFYFRINKDKAL